MKKIVLLCAITISCSFSQPISIDSCLSQIADSYVDDSTRGIHYYLETGHQVSPSRQKVLEFQSYYHVTNGFISDSMKLSLFKYCNRSEREQLVTFIPFDSLDFQQFYYPSFVTSAWNYWSPKEDTVYIGVKNTTLGNSSDRYLFLSIYIGDPINTKVRQIRISSGRSMTKRSTVSFLVNGRIHSQDRSIVGSMPSSLIHFSKRAP